MERRRDNLLAQALADSNWGVVTDLARGGASAECRAYVLHEAMKECRWECITHLVQQGVSPEQRDVVVKEALKHSQWRLVLMLARLGVSVEQRDLAFHKAVRYRRWDVMDELLKLGITQQHRDFAVRRCLEFVQPEFDAELAMTGITFQYVAEQIQDYVWNSVGELNDMVMTLSQEMTKSAMSEITRQEKWQFVPKLVQLSAHPVVKDFALREAVAHQQWDCMRELTEMGLTDQQRECICNEAIVWNRPEYAIALLREGVDPCYTRWIVKESFRQNKWPLLVNMERWTPQEDVKLLVLKAALTYRQRGAFSEFVRIHGVTDSELSQVMMTAINELAHGFLYHIITSTRKGRRVFKQLCLKTQITKGTVLSVHINLITMLEPDLAFYLAATQDRWDLVRSLYVNSWVRTRSRHFAFQRAAQSGAWDFVFHIACDNLTPQRDRRSAFLEAVKQKDWGWAMKIFTDNSRMAIADVRFAVKACGSAGRLDVALEMCQRRDVMELGTGLAKSVFRYTIQTNALTSFRRLCEFSEIIFRPDMVAFICRKAFHFHRTNLVFEMFGACDMFDSEGVEESVVETAVQYMDWDFLRQLIRRGYGGCFEDTLSRCLRKIGRRQSQLSRCLPIFEDWCKEDDTLELGINFLSLRDLDHGLALDLTKWCRVHSLWNLAFIFSIVCRRLSVIKTVVKRHHRHICGLILVHGVRSVLDDDDVKVAVILLPFLDEDDLDDVDTFGTHHGPLIKRCKDAGLTRWVIYFAMLQDDWDMVETTAMSCLDMTLLQNTAKRAAMHNKWRLVRNLLGKCTQGPNEFFAGILQKAVSHGECQCTQIVLERVDPRSASLGLRTILLDAVTSSDNREDILRLCIGSGVSTHLQPIEISYHSPMKRALENGQLPLVRLLHESGSSSNRELYLLKNNAAIRTQLERQHRQDIMQYVDQAASNPCSLQHLCRLTVSHLVGCRPGRRERIASLPLPQCVQEFLSFADLF